MSLGHWIALVCYLAQRGDQNLYRKRAKPNRCHSVYARSSSNIFANTLQSTYSHSRILKAKQVFGWWQFNHIDTSTCRSNQQKRPTQLELTKLTFSTISHQTLSPTEVPGLHDSVEGEELGINIAVQKTVGFRVVSNDF